MSSPWLAIDVATAPAQRARELRRSWESFVGGDLSEPTHPAEGEASFVRAPIVASWRRSVAAGVDPSGHRMAPVVADADEASARWEIHPLADMAPLIRACLAATADESQHLIVVSDANGVLLWVEGNARMRLRAADSMNFAEGALWSEGDAGTNAIGTALAAEHAVQVFASEHFNEVVQDWMCAAAPVHDPDTGQVIGVIDLTGEMATVHPHSMAVATATATAVEAHLRCEMLDRDARLLARYGDRLTAGSEPRAPPAPSGRVIASQPLGWLPSARLTLPGHGGRDAPGPLAARPRARRGRDPRRAGGRRRARLAADAPRRDPHPAVRQPRGAHQRGAERRGVWRSAARRLDSRGDLAAAQAAGRLHRDRALPPARRGGLRRGPGVACCTAARCARPPHAIPGRSCPARPRRASRASARRSRAGCANR